ncbi:hypothetical protein B9Q03_01915 [Candidatus Marsarchaeota G2 archaeon OSP_D]|uniref:Phosphatidate cytidylyltransferase n=5 Tax=Candidatus Marsarchaeota group 2 TaxID=2203771 RepID=A0A2R6C883_9ARCH|nr:MAG: hypothetical protein B9Q03_01915 [Candidatus Marsarchaeota G2 archaeon OSP_D]PSN92922.1 MAG: hypothetical protein B9Q08_00250 [Candidatus Marsarchaeota G2 archaeon ECH_B_SAG-M15]PSN93463.1 MAG: hypothetical protein B9Q06_11975 [Candidatus Marsarchaeota G2 archaeon ECH_B_2]PSN99323.1 MAG: hypothetical protein B9Q05_11925 [Candidatus Marsarchaeota G2 archaeon ECH_B_1]PSO06976.1 MAG: hypothetical protein B9Q04_13300 [Candidatus Marsarchaeota G2 archaeon BE_D]
MDREAAGITLIALTLCTVSWFFERYVAAISFIVALAVLFGYRGLLLKPRDAKLTVARKLPHVGGGLIVSGLLLAGWRWLAIGLTSAATFGYLYLILNHSSNRGSGVLSNLALQFGLIMENGGKPVYLSSTFYAFSALALLLLLYYPKPAIGGILTLTVSDTVAAVVGLHGKVKIPRLGKTVEGSAAMFVSSALILMAIGVPFYIAGIVALCATIIEMLPLPVDDNFLIPLIVGILLEALII